VSFGRASPADVKDVFPGNTTCQNRKYYRDFERILCWEYCDVTIGCIILILRATGGVEGRGGLEFAVTSAYGDMRREYLAELHDWSARKGALDMEQLQTPTGGSDSQASADTSACTPTFPPSPAGAQPAGALCTSDERSGELLSCQTKRTYTLQGALLW
jgi:hypothetical protein